MTCQYLESWKWEKRSGTVKRSGEHSQRFWSLRSAHRNEGEGDWHLKMDSQRVCSRPNIEMKKIIPHTKHLTEFGYRLHVFCSGYHCIACVRTHTQAHTHTHTHTIYTHTHTHTHTLACLHAHTRARLHTSPKPGNEAQRYTRCCALPESDPIFSWTKFPIGTVMRIQIH